MAISDFSGLAAGWFHPSNMEWFSGGGKACGVDPAYYVDAHVPHLYSFEDCGEGNVYAQRMTAVVRDLELTLFFTHYPGRAFSLYALPRQASPIDFAWNDAQDYKAFFEELWPALNPSGGVMVFHNTVAWRTH